MRLENNLAIRRRVGPLLHDDVALAVNDGWHGIVARALTEIRDIVDEAGVHVEITHVEERRGGLVIRTDALAQRVPTPVADAIAEIRFHAADRSSMTCERCGALGFAIRCDEPRVRCGRCENEEAARQVICQEYRDHIAEACQYYIGVCIEHERLFRVENVVIQGAPLGETERRFFLDEVHERLCWWRASSWIAGVDEMLRGPFRKLDFDRVHAAEEWAAVRALFPEDFREVGERNALRSAYAAGWRNENEVEGTLEQGGRSSHPRESPSRTSRDRSAVHTVL